MGYQKNGKDMWVEQSLKHHARFANHFVSCIFFVACDTLCDDRLFMLIMPIARKRVNYRCLFVIKSDNSLYLVLQRCVASSS